MRQRDVVGIATACLLVVGAVAGCDTGGGSGDEESGWFQWVFNTLSGVPKAARPCRRSYRQSIGADPREALRMIRKDCVSLIDNDDCRQALEKRFDKAAYRTCYTSYCPTFEGDGPRLCQMPADEAVELEPHDVRWEEFYTYVLATDRKWAEPMPQAAYQMKREAQKNADAEDSENSATFRFTKTVDLSVGELVAQQFAGAIDLGRSKQRWLDSDE
ncbi:MAG: hypothetical protein ABEN55_11390 [Bradymonadaceae bacterium]